MPKYGSTKSGCLLDVYASFLTAEILHKPLARLFTPLYQRLHARHPVSHVSPKTHLTPINRLLYMISKYCILNYVDHVHL